MSDMGKLFSAFDERKRNEAEQEEAERAKRDAALRKAVGVFRSQVLPALHEAAEMVRQRGHVAEVRERLDGILNPSVELLFRVSGVNAIDSRLVFLHPVDGQSLSIGQEINSPANAPSRSYKSNKSVAIDQVNEAMTRELLMQFIQAVLDVN